MTTTTRKNLISEGHLFHTFNHQNKVEALTEWFNSHRIEVISHCLSLTTDDIKAFCSENNITIPRHHRGSNPALHGDVDFNASKLPEKMNFLKFMNYSRNSQLQILSMLISSNSESAFSSLIKDYFGLIEPYKFFINMQASLKKKISEESNVTLGFKDPFDKKDSIDSNTPTTSTATNDSLVSPVVATSSNDTPLPNQYEFVTEESFNDSENTIQSDFNVNVGGIEISLKGDLSNANFSFNNDSFSFNLSFKNPNSKNSISENDLPF